jgi:HPt (histidine-containing phosphotransfer) domain-containing protein
MSADKEKIARFTQMLLEMKQDYLVGLPGKIAGIKKLIHAQSWTDLQEEFHKLKGTGKTYGFPQVSIVCERLETLLAENPEKEAQFFQNGAELLERMHLAYTQNQSFALEQDDFARSLLALK